MRASFSQILDVCSKLNIKCEAHDYYYEVWDADRGWVIAYIRNRYRELLAEGRIVRAQHNSNIEFDCDDYAWLFTALCRLYGIACGFALGYMEADGKSYYHAFNILPYHYSNKLHFFLVEPQNTTYNLPWMYPMSSNAVDGVRFNYHTKLYRYVAVYAVF